MIYIQPNQTQAMKELLTKLVWYQLNAKYPPSYLLDVCHVSGFHSLCLENLSGWFRTLQILHALTLGFQVYGHT